MLAGSSFSSFFPATNGLPRLPSSPPKARRYSYLFPSPPPPLRAPLTFSTSPPPPCAASAPSPPPWSGDLRFAEFPWNSLPFLPETPPPSRLKIAVFSRKWPSSSSPGGMERHALTLHSALSLRGHEIHVFTSALDGGPSSSKTSLRLHPLAGRWRCDEAFALYEAENAAAPFDVVHSESVAVFHRFAGRLPNLAVSWHGISLEALHSSIRQDLLRRRGREPLSPSFNRTLASAIYRVLDEARFFESYAHHVAISDSAGEILRDVYQIPRGRC